MRLVSRSLFVAGLLTLAACGTGGGTPPGGTQLAGTYNGSLQIADATPFVDTITTFKLDSAGNLSGTTTSRDRTPVPWTLERSKARLRAAIH